MNFIRRKVLALLIIVVLCVPFLTACNRNPRATAPEPEQMPTRSAKPSPEKVVEKSTADLVPGKVSNDYHRFGFPVDGSLMWENDENFKKAYNAVGATVRMGAFQTTLPDPLPGEEVNVAIGADKLAGAVVKPGEVFSVNHRVGPYTEEHGFKKGPTYAGTKVVQTIGGGVCKISTTTYNAAVLANMKIIERHPHGMLVPYVPEGQDATVLYDYKDFKFKNNTDHPILIWADTKDNTLYVGIYGQGTPPKVTWHHQFINRQKMPTIYRYNPDLQPGEEKIIIPGADGVTVKSWVTVEYSDGKVESVQRGTDYYKPMPQVIERGK